MLFQMYKANLIVPTVAFILGLSLVGMIMFRHLEISELYNQDKELGPLNLQNEESLTPQNYQREKTTEINNVHDLLNSNYAKTLYNPRQVSSLKSLYFDRDVYFPPVKVFWDLHVSVPVELTLVYGNVEFSSARVKISSNVDSRELTLARVAPGVFKGTVLVVGLRLGECLTGASFNVRYGDEIVAQYYDTFSVRPLKASALFLLPIYIMDDEEASSNLAPYKLFDSEGVPMVNYGSSTGVQYNPVIICNYALANYQMYLTTGNLTFRQIFLVQVNWLVRNAEQKGNFSVWEYKFNWPSPAYNATNPFASALAQGEGLSVLTRAYTLTGNETYLDVAETAMHSFEVDMSSGGVRYTDTEGVWYEEIADVGARSGKVLNGFLFSLFGLYEYWFETNSSNGYALFSEGVHTLSSNLHLYDTGSWSYYDLLHFSSAPLDYHKIHIKQLRILYELTSFEIFLAYSNKFQSYIH